MTNKKRIEELERRVRELESAPREQHLHFHAVPRPTYVPDWTWRPQFSPWYTTTRTNRSF